MEVNKVTAAERGASTPPVAPRHAHLIMQHGETREDDFFWLRDRDDPQVLAYLAAENAYTEQMLAHTQPLQEQLYNEMKARMQETDLSVPVTIGEYLYYTRTETGRQYPIHCRRRAGTDASEEILLDENVLAGDRPFFHVGAFQVSPDHRWLAYSTDTNGAEAFTLTIKDLLSGQTLDDCIQNTSYGLAWASDNRTLFYSVLDKAKRPYRVYRHVVGTDPAHDVLVYEEPDDAFHVWVGTTSSKRYLLIYLWAGDTSEVHYAPADHPTSPFRILQPRNPGIEYSVAHQDNRFLIVTNENAQNFRLMEAPIEDLSRDNWHEVIPNKSDTMLDGIDVFGDYLVRYEREGGLRHIRVADRGGSRERDVTFPEPTYAFNATGNEDFDARILRFQYSSFITPDSVIDYDMADDRWQVRKQEAIAGYDPSQYKSVRIYATAPDGKQVPLSLVYRNDLAMDRSHPALLTGYGAYGISNDPWFDANRLSLLDRGFVCALAHIRGGSELGRAWFEDGRLLHKRNSFDDFIACAECLIDRGYTSPNRLAIMGGSAGGLMIGAVVNMRPDLFRAVIADVPFVDVITTMSDPTIPLTINEYGQWGNPRDKAYYDYMKTYSPYDNVKAQAYPSMLVTSGIEDPRVAYWEPVKWVARLRSVKTDDHLLLLKLNMDAGHGGPSGRYNYLRQVAVKYAYLLDQLGGAPSARDAAMRSRPLAPDA